MATLISLIVFNLQCLVILITFFYSLFIYKRISPNYMKYFVIYTTIAFIVMVPIFIKNNLILDLVFADWLNNFSLIFNFSFLVFFILLSMPDVKGRYLYLIIFGVFLLLIISSIFMNNAYLPVNSAFSINHLGLIFFSISYLFKLFSNTPDKDLKKMPVFWIVIGVLFCSLVNFPIVTLIDYFLIRHINYTNNIILRNIPPFAYLVMYSMFLKSLSCSIQK